MSKITQKVLECRKWRFKRWGFKQIQGYLRKRAFFCVFWSQTSASLRSSSCRLSRCGQTGSGPTASGEARMWASLHGVGQQKQDRADAADRAGEATNEEPVHHQAEATTRTPQRTEQDYQRRHLWIGRSSSRSMMTKIFFPQGPEDPCPIDTSTCWHSGQENGK